MSSDNPDLVRIRAILRIEADGVRIEPDATAEIRAELVEALVACGAARVVKAR